MHQPLSVDFSRSSSLLSTVPRRFWLSLTLSLAGLVCGWFWEMWKVGSMPKWIYVVPYFGSPKLFEMPLLGYGGYLPFLLEVFAVWSLVQGFLGGHGRDWLRFTRPRKPRTAVAADGCRR
jgi:hypothetical protein